MRGKVLGYDDRTGRGVISGDDGQRYAFAQGALEGGTRLVLAGQDVDFEVQDKSAAGIFLVRSPLGSDKNKYVAAALAFFFGMFGAHKFYLGHVGIGIAYLLAGTIGWLIVLPPMMLGIVCLIEAILLITKSDEDFHREYVIEKRRMF